MLPAHTYLPHSPKSCHKYIYDKDYESDVNYWYMEDECGFDESTNCSNCRNWFSIFRQKCDNVDECGVIEIDGFSERHVFLCMLHDLCCICVGGGYVDKSMIPDVKS